MDAAKAVLDSVGERTRHLAAARLAKRFLSL
jgi:hypothetical protein